MVQEKREGGGRQLEGGVHFRWLWSELTSQNIHYVTFELTRILSGSLTLTAIFGGGCDRFYVPFSQASELGECGHDRYCLAGPLGSCTMCNFSSFWAGWSELSGVCAKTSADIFLGPLPDTCVSRAEIISLPMGLWLETGIGNCVSQNAREKMPDVHGDQLPKWAVSALTCLTLSAAFVKAESSLWVLPPAVSPGFQDATLSRSSSFFPGHSFSGSFLGFISLLNPWILQHPGPFSPYHPGGRIQSEVVHKISIHWHLPDFSLQARPFPWSQLLHPTSHLEKPLPHLKPDRVPKALFSFSLLLLGKWQPWLLMPNPLEPSCLPSFPHILPPIHP